MELIELPPLFGPSEKGQISKTHKTVGDQVSSGELIAEVEFDIATADLESTVAGTILYMNEGPCFPGEPVVIIGAENDDWQAFLKEWREQGRGNELTANKLIHFQSRIIALLEKHSDDGDGLRGLTFEEILGKLDEFLTQKEKDKSLRKRRGWF